MLETELQERKSRGKRGLRTDLQKNLDPRILEKEGRFSFSL